MNKITNLTLMWFFTGVNHLVFPYCGSVVLNTLFLLNPLGFSHPYQMDESTFIFRDIRNFFFISFFVGYLFSKQNSPRWDATFCNVTSGATYSVCLCPIKRMPGLYGLISVIHSLFWLQPQSDIHDSGHDSSRFELDGKIGVHRDGKKENPASILCLMIPLWCLDDSSTVPLRFMTAALRMLTMHPRFDTVLVRFRPVVPRHPPCDVFLMTRNESA